MLREIELHGFKSFDKKTKLDLGSRVSAIVGPNGSGKSNVAEALRWVLGEQSMKSMRGKRGEDLIFSGSKMVPRQNRASVAITFDNRTRRIPLEYDAVTISREVYRDGTNRYLVNGSAVRLKDVFELLSAVGIGGTSYHIISQGEADRILMAKPEVRKEMIEEALGLNAYQFKKAETERKLAGVSENLREIVALRRELMPQLRFLKAEIDKLDRFQTVHDELTIKYADYFARERDALAFLGAEIERQQAFLLEKQKELGEADNGALRTRREELRGEKEKLARALGRVEGVLAAARSVEEAQNTEGTVSRSETRETVCRSCGQVLLKHEISHDATGSEKVSDDVRPEMFDIEALLLEKNSIEEKMQTVEEEAKLLGEQLGRMSQLVARKADIARELARVCGKKEHFLAREKQLERDLVVAIERAGRAVLAYEQVPEASVLPEEELTMLRREIERLVIRLEEVGGVDASVRSEYDALLARDEHFSREIEDLKSSHKGLSDIMSELSARIETEFRVGMEKINDHFAQFFAVLFGGGEACLLPVLISDEGEPERYGLEVSVQIPHKKVKTLQLLSGGERSLASVALLFAMSQVNQPPFLVLDETDAALDESNSRRYGEMLEKLSETSQLVIITHNRETMARAGRLYGVTMAGDGTSRVLSVQLAR